MVQGGRARVKGTTEGRHYKEITRLSMEFCFLLQTEKMQTTGALLIPPALVSCGSRVLCSARSGSHQCLMNELRGAWHPDVIGSLGRL